MLGKTTSLQIRTPEGVSFHLPLAGPVSRGLALLVDGAMIIAILLVVSGLFGIFSQFFFSIPVLGRVLVDFTEAVSILFTFALIMLYGIVLEWAWKGRTVGKRLFNLRVIDERGLPLGAGQIVIRNLFRLVDILPSLFYLVGGISCALTKRCQRLGDIAAGTVVIREVTVPEPEISGLLDETENSFASVPHLEARLRHLAGPEDARIALDAVLRREELGKEDRLRVFQTLADHFRELTEFPEEITIGLSDEQYVRNVVDTLFRRAIT